MEKGRLSGSSSSGAREEKDSIRVSSIEILTNARPKSLDQMDDQGERSAKKCGGEEQSRAERCWIRRGGSTTGGAWPEWLGLGVKRIVPSCVFMRSGWRRVVFDSRR